MPWSNRVFTRVANSFSGPSQGTIIDPADAEELFDAYDAALSAILDGTAGSFTPLAYSTTLTGTSTSAAALSVGRQGATDPVLKINASTASVATGLEIVGAAAAGGVNLRAISSGTNEPLTINAKGSGTITLGDVSTGAIALTRATTAPTLNGNTFTTGTYTLTGVAGKTLTFNKTLTLDGTDGTAMTFPTTTATIARTDAAQTFTGVQTFAGGSAAAPGVTVGNAGVGLYSTASNNLAFGVSGGPLIDYNITTTNRITLGASTVTTGSFLSLFSLGGIGYGTGAGGAVTQDTNRTTGVTLDKVCGAITLVSAAGSASYQSFTVTNSTVAALDTVIVNQKSGTDLYEIHVTAVGAGSFRITYRTTGGTTTEQPVFNFAVVKAVAS